MKPIVMVMGSIILGALVFGILDLVILTNKFNRDKKDAHNEAFEQYLKLFGKGYKSLENYNKRKETFSKMLDQIKD
tara:strand:- start:244 stop:471 length:228 start_codon:yes stop_codon:yes gene_type:complete